MAKTIFNQKLSNGTTVKCRKVYHRDLDRIVLLTTRQEYEAHAIVEDSYDDRMFYCYPNETEFMTMNDAEFEEYINTQFN